MAKPEEFSPEKYLTVKRQEFFPIEYSQEKFDERWKYIKEENGENFNYVVPKTKEQWQKQEAEYKEKTSFWQRLEASPFMGQSFRLSWEESKQIWDKVNSVTDRFNKLSENDKEVPPIDNIIISNKGENAALYRMAWEYGSSIELSSKYLEKHKINSKESLTALEHEVGHHYDIVQNGLKVVSYDLKRHLQDSNPEFVKWLEDKGVSDDDFKKFSLNYGITPLTYFKNLLNEKKSISVDEYNEMTNLYSSGHKEFSINRNIFLDEYPKVKELAIRQDSLLKHQFEFVADKNAAILDCKHPDSIHHDGKHVITEYIPSDDRGFLNLPSEKQDITKLEGSGTHPHPMLRLIEMEKIKALCEHTSTEELMKLPTPVSPKIPSKGKSPHDGHSH